MDQEHEKTVIITLYPPVGEPIAYLVKDEYFSWGINTTERYIHFDPINEPGIRYKSSLPFTVKSGMGQ